MTPELEKALEPFPTLKEQVLKTNLAFTEAMNAVDRANDELMATILQLNEIAKESEKCGKN